MPDTCPRHADLLALLRGELAEGALAEIGNHLDSCSACRRQLEELSADMTPRGRSALQSPETQSPALLKLMQQLRDADADATTPRTPDVEAPLLREFRDYEVLEELGRGGMGVVFRARHKRLHRIVALKVIAAGELASAAEVRRFHAEAEAAARLDHPNIVPIYEVGEHGGRQFISMKLVEGRTLAERLRELRATKSCQALASLLGAVARAVHYAHQRSILHRDLKPGNVLLDAQGEPHLTDFGLAKLLDSDSELTRSQVVMGTPDYLAPEVAAGRARDVTTAADVFSLGAILYELLTGTPPFQAETAAATLDNVLRAEPRPPKAINPAAPRDLETIALKCLEKEPARRYASAAALADELERFVHGETILARPVLPPERVWRWARRKPLLASLVVALHVVLALGLAGILWQWQRADRHAREETRLRERAQTLASGEARERQRAEDIARREAEQRARAEQQRAELLLAQGEVELPLALLAALLREAPTNAALASRIRSVLDCRGVSVPLPLEFQHGTRIHTVLFSPDGRTLLTIADGETIAQPWDARTGEPRRPLNHRWVVAGAAFSSDGAVLATATTNGNLRLWRGTDGVPLGPRLVHGDEAPVLAFSPDGRRLASASAGALRLWAMPGGREIAFARRPPDGPMRGVAFSPDGRWLLTQGEGSTVLWRAADLEPAGTAPGISHAAFTPDSDHLLLDHRRLWNWRERLELSTPLEVGDEPLFGSAFSPDGRSVLVAAGELGGRLCDLETLALRVPPLRHEQPVTRVAFSRDGGMVLTGGTDGVVEVWDSRTGELLTAPLRHNGPIVSAEFSPDGTRLLVLPAGPRAWLWDLRLNGSPSFRGQHAAGVTSLRFSRDGTKLLTSSRDGTARLWEPGTGRELIPPLRHAAAINATAWSPDEHRIATVGDDGALKLWDERTGAALHSPPAQSSALRTVEFDSAGIRLLTAGNDGTARVFNAATGEPQFAVKHLAALTSAHFSAADTQILTASRDGSAGLWDARTGEAALAWLRHRDAVVGAAFAPDGERVVTASRDATARFWDRHTGKPLGTPLRHAAGLHPGVLRFDASGQWLLTAAGYSAYVWRVDSGQEACPPLAHLDLVLDARFSPDGRVIATASRDDTARLWFAATGAPLGEPLRHAARVECLAFSPDGRWLATGSADGAVRLWEVPKVATRAPVWLADLAEAMGRKRINEHGHAEPVPPRALADVKRAIQASDATDDFAVWANWLLRDSQARPVTPHSALSPSNNVNLLLAGGQLENLRAAARLAPASPRVHARLALALSDQMTPDRLEALREADWHSRYALALAPADAEVRAARQAVEAALGTLPAAAAPVAPGSKAGGRLRASKP